MPLPLAYLSPDLPYSLGYELNPQHPDRVGIVLSLDIVPPAEHFDLFSS